MTATTATSCYQYMREDKDYQSLTERIQKCHVKRNKLEGEQRTLLFRLQALAMARDAVCKQMFKHEDVSDKTDKILSELTTDDSESWACGYSQALDLMLEKSVELCVKVANLKVDADVQSTNAKALSARQDTLGDKLREKYHTMTK